MAQCPEVLVAASGWTQLNSLASKTLMELCNKGPDDIYVLIQAGDPGAGVAATTGRPVLANRGEWMIRLATGDNVWARTTTLQVTGAGTQVYEATA
jgi:hypothetical protein